MGRRLALALAVLMLWAAPLQAKPHWRGDARTRGLAGTFLGVWMDSGTWRKAWVASDRNGIFLTIDGMDTLKPVSDDLYRMLRKEGMEPVLTGFGSHPARFETLYAFFNVGPLAPKGAGATPLPATARGEGRFLVSLDAGRSWRAIGVQVDSAWFSPDSNVIVVATDNGRLWRSTDAGVSFMPFAELLRPVLQKIGPDPLGRQMRLHVPAVRRAPDGKLTADWYTLLTSPSDGGATVVAGSWGRATSTDGGDNWQVEVFAAPFLGPETLPGSLEGLPVPRMDPYFRMTPAGLQRSTDRGGTWHPLVLKPTLGSVRMMTVDVSGRVTYALAETGLFRQDPESRLWVALLRPVHMMNDTAGPGVPAVTGPHPEAFGPPRPAPEDVIFRNPQFIMVDREDPNHLYFCCGVDGLFEVMVGPDDRFRARHLWVGALGDLYQDPMEPRYLYSGGMARGTLWWSHDKGRDWKVVHDLPVGKVRFAATATPGFPVWALVFDAERPTALLGAFASPDHGGSWKAVNQEGPFAVEELLDVSYSGNRAWAVAREKWKPRLFETTNGGLHWKAITLKPLSAFNRHTRIFDDPVFGLVGVGVEPRVVSLRGSRKFADVVVASHDGGVHWGTISDGLPMRGKVVDFAATRGSLFMLLGDERGQNPVLWEYR